MKQFSLLLQSIFKELQAPITWEHFLSHILNLLDIPLSWEDTQELIKCHHMLSNYDIDLKVLQERLSQLLQSRDFEDLRPSRAEAFQKALEKVCESDASVIYVPQLFSLLFEDRYFVEELLDRCKMKEDKKEEMAFLEKMLIEDYMVGQISQEEREALFTPRERVSALVEEVRTLRHTLNAKVLGQAAAIDSFLDGYFRSYLAELTGDGQKNKPAATFLFAGAPGVGKTMLAEAVADCLGREILRVDMSGYGDRDSLPEFCGYDKNYKSPRPGNVTGYVEENPRCVVLFDEVEKADLTIIHLLLQLLDNGRVYDLCLDKNVSFEKAIVIFTTNAGKQLYEGVDNSTMAEYTRKTILDGMLKDVNPRTKEPYFPAAICSRFARGNVVLFQHIDPCTLIRIAQKTIQRESDEMGKAFGIELQVEDNLCPALLMEHGVSDARVVSGRVPLFISREIREFLCLLSASGDASFSSGKLERIEMRLDLSDATEEVQGLFSAPQSPEILVFASEENVELCRSLCPDHVILGAQDADAASRILSEHDVLCVLTDMRFGISKETFSLNVEDVDSSAREFVQYLRESSNSRPIFLIEFEESNYSDEEKGVFYRSGVYDSIPFYLSPEQVRETVWRVTRDLYYSHKAQTLFRTGKVLSYSTRQSIEDGGARGVVTLYDLKTKLALEAEDTKDIISSRGIPDVTFKDVIGAKDAKAELKHFINYLNNPKRFLGTGIKPPKGVLLYGPPGTGKTLLAKAVARYAGLPFLATEGNRFMRGDESGGAQYVHKLFATARKYAPAVLFIDEIDVIGKMRGMGNALQEEVLTAFLTEMDGFASHGGRTVFVLGATNYDALARGHRQSLDSALLRRFDRALYIGLPNREEREEFLDRARKENPALAFSDELKANVAMRSAGQSLSDLQQIISLSLRLAVRTNEMKVTDDILEEAFESFFGGAARSTTENELKRVACHEAGHALIMLASGKTPSYVTIVARGDHGGYVQHPEEEDRLTYTKEDLLSRICVSMGGRAAELLCFGAEEGLTTGASADLAQATSLARQIFATFGMAESFGLATLTQAEQENNATLLSHTNELLSEQLEKAVRILTLNRAHLDCLVEALLASNSLTGEEIKEKLSALGELIPPRGED